MRFPRGATLIEARSDCLEAIKKCVLTASIGTLSRFEEYFGHLWGHDRPESELSENQKQWRATWMACRADALTHINNQIRNEERKIWK